MARPLTLDYLKKLVMEEKAKLEEEKASSASPDLDAEKPDEVDASEYADTLEKDIDYLAALKVRESKLRQELKRVLEVKKTVRNKILSSQK